MRVPEASEQGGILGSEETDMHFFSDFSDHCDYEPQIRCPQYYLES